MLSDSSGNTVTFFFLFLLVSKYRGNSEIWTECLFGVLCDFENREENCVGDFAVKEVLLTTRPE